MFILILNTIVSLFLSGQLTFLEGQTCTTKQQPRVADLYPRATVLPKNLLRFYVYFDHAMDTATSAGQIEIRTSSGKVLDDLLLQSRAPLWSEDGRRLTLILDPGRIKTGLSHAHQPDSGFKVGEEFTLVIGQGFTTETGCEMAAVFEHQFFIARADTTPPNPKNWVLNAPSAMSRDPLTVSFKKPLDHLSLAYRIRVKTITGQSIPGAISLGKDDEHWIFTPSEVWAEGPYNLVIDSRLEDLAGNRPTGLFDAPVGQRSTRGASAAPLQLAFKIDHP